MDNFFFENDPLDVRAGKDAIKQKVLSLQEVAKKMQNGDTNRIYSTLTLQTAKLFPLKRVLKNVEKAKGLKLENAKRRLKTVEQGLTY